ncbi:hypothetical protein PSTG_08314 [Puccinia striiformis f. sp. tritici PST-78]|uniref:Uncharacterized protein n=1 Tax=Puccinia striiformis f. sp. tritici PST-78 TaxID=1165861 RepID=A0A0L0VHC3_9BASI|nr:hypothetical protein PSTG_08314 [Puccinia striiformis f. sp. tritici PST-78]
MDLQVCTCTTCIKHTITTPNGEAIPGSWVHPSTRRRHWAQNLTPQDNNHIPVSALPSIPPPDETSPASEPDSEPADTLSEVESITWCVVYLGSYQDSRTITKHLGLDPEIESSICCPKCFSLYEHEDAPTICAYHRSKKAQVCGEGLFKTNADKLLPGYQPVSLIRQRYPPPFKPFTPRLVYHTQPFNSWLKWFLNVPGIEDKIFAWREKVKSTTDNRIVDIQQSKARHSFQFCTDREPARNELRLTFSVFIDWLNPFSNKLAGRQVSMGVIALTCLDLSPRSRNKHNNIFIAVSWRPKIISTPRCLNRGHGSHTQHSRFCVSCGYVLPFMVPVFEKRNDAHAGWPNLNSARHKITSHQWRDSDTLVEQKRLLTLHGTRWSELNRLPYWDPVKNVAIGVMHNWYEGVLQHHWRVRWAFEPEPSKHLTHDDQLNDWEDDKSSDSQTSLHFQDNALAHI